jgi:hypothetical protein
MVFPDTFVVGAPRCGTTALHNYLAQHPQIYMTEPKEPHHFGQDLWVDQFEFFRRFRDPAAYRALYAGIGPQHKRAGEGSVWYLYSRTAAREIHAFNPAARIVITLRHPVDYLYSLHGHMIVSGEEPVEDFERAVRLSADARLKAGIKLTGRLKYGFDYLPTARFSGQVRRYLEVFGPEQVHVVLLDDIQRAPQETYAGILRFLDVDPTFEATFEQINSHRVVKNRRLLQVITNQSPLRRAVTDRVPRRVREKLWAALNSRATEYKKREKLDAEARARMTTQFAEEIEALGAVIGRDLSPWLAGRA